MRNMVRDVERRTLRLPITFVRYRRQEVQQARAAPQNRLNWARDYLFES